QGEVYDTDRLHSLATASIEQPMTFAPFVLITSTTETLRELPRVLVNEAYTDAIAAAGLIPVVLPPVSPAVAVAAIEDIAGLVLTGGEDIDPRHFGQSPHPAT